MFSGGPVHPDLTCRRPRDPGIHALIAELLLEVEGFPELFLAFEDSGPGYGLLAVGEVVIRSGAAEDCLDIPESDAVGAFHFPTDTGPVGDLLRIAATVGRSDGCGIVVDIVGEPDW